MFLAGCKEEIPVSLAAVFQVNLPTLFTHLSVINATLEECSLQVHILRSSVALEEGKNEEVEVS